MTKRLFQTIAVSASSIVGVAAVTALPANQVQAAVLTYQSNLNVTSTVVLPDQSTTQTPIANASVIFTKAPSAAQPGLFDYEFKSFTSKFLTTTYTLADLLPPTNIALVQSLNTLLPTKYQSVLPAILNGTSPTYTGDGDFPPADPISYAFSSQDISTGISLVAPDLSPDQLSFVNTAAALFPNGGEATFSSTLLARSLDPLSTPSEGAPEPTTVAGLALAGTGMFAARRRFNNFKKRKAVAS